MIGVDFRTPGIGERAARTVAAAFERARRFRAGLIIAAALSACVGSECVRLGSALHDLQRLERRRETLAADVQRVHTRVRMAREKRAMLVNVLARRRSNVDLASRIATAGDVLAPSMALVHLSAAPEGFDLEGRGTNVSEIRLSLAKLEAVFDRPAIFELRRDDAEANVLSFHVGIPNK